MELLGTEVLAGLAAVLALGAGLVGWRIRRMGEDSRRRALEASCREEIAAAGRARDRARQETNEVAERLERLRDEHDDCAPKIAALESQLARQEARTSIWRRCASPISCATIVAWS